MRIVRCSRPVRRERFDATSSRQSLSLHRDLFVETFLITEDRRKSKRLSVANESNSDIVLLGLSVDFHGIPFLGVADVVDADVVVLTPEERRVVEPLASAENISR